MPSIRPSQYALQQRRDEGPFLRIEREDFEDSGELDPIEIDEGIELDDVEVDGISRVYYSDVALTDPDSLEWHLLLEVSPYDLTIYPIVPRSEHPQYAEPKYDTLKSIRITRPVHEFYALPNDQNEVEELLEGLPSGFSKDWRHGLGFHYEYRYIAHAIASIEGVEKILVCGERSRNETRIEGDTYILGVSQFELIRKRLNQLTQRHQRDTAGDKKLVCYAGLLHKASAERYPPRARKLSPDVLANLVSLGSISPQLSKKDQRHAVELAQQSVPAMAQSEPRTLYSLKAEIELVTLGQLIEIYRTMLESKLAESKWQAFLSEHPFVLDMAFGYPVKKIADQPYVGGKSFTGRGGQYSDFLMAAKATGNLALIEIKHPQHELLGNAYRKTFIPSYELSGSVAQIISQRAHVQREIFGLAHELNERVHAHAVAAIVIIGRTPDAEEKQRAFEQYRHALKDVLVVTFDELLDRLVSIHQALTSPPQADPGTIGDEDLPF